MEKERGEPPKNTQASQSDKTLARYFRVIDEWFKNGFKNAEAYQKEFTTASVKTAGSNFPRMMKVEAVKNYVEQKREEARQYIDTDCLSILQELKRWIEADITTTISLKPEELKELPIEFRRLINRYKVTSTKNYDRDGNLVSEVETITLSMVSKEKAMDMINRHIGFYEMDNSQKSDGINIFATNEGHAKLISTILDGN